MTVRADYLIAAAIAATLGASATNAAEPPPADWRQMIDAKLGGYLKDPYSAVKLITRGPRHGSVKTGVFQHTYGWGVCYSINAKNGYGGFTGAKNYLFVIDEARSITIIDGADEDTFKASLIERECSMPADDAAPPSQVGTSI